MKSFPYDMKAEDIKKEIETTLNKRVDFATAYDGANLLFSATINGYTYANVYKSFNKYFKPIIIIRYTNVID